MQTQLEKKINAVMETFEKMGMLSGFSENEKQIVKCDLKDIWYAAKLECINDLQNTLTKEQ